MTKSIVENWTWWFCRGVWMTERAGQEMTLAHRFTCAFPTTVTHWKWKKDTKRLRLCFRKNDTPCTAGVLPNCPLISKWREGDMCSRSREEWEPWCRGGCRQHILELVKEVFPEAGDVPAAEDWVSGGGLLGGGGADREPEHPHLQELVTAINYINNGDGLLKKENTTIWPHSGARGSAVAHPGVQTTSQCSWTSQAFISAEQPFFLPELCGLSFRKLYLCLVVRDGLPQSCSDSHMCRKEIWILLL